MRHITTSLFIIAFWLLLRYFDNNRDMKLEYVEFKELMAAARASRQLSIDALSVARDADVCLRFGVTVYQSTCQERCVHRRLMFRSLCETMSGGHGEKLERIV